MKLNIRTICLPIALLSIPQAIQAEEKAPGKSVILAIGRMEMRHGWLSISSPGDNDQLVARISANGLNLASPDGKAAMRTRIGHASADLCRMALDNAEAPDSRVTAERKCMREAEAKALRNLDQTAGI